MDEMKRVLGSMRRAIQTYEMIKPGDRIAVGVSGGKDSMVLLYALSRYQKFSPVPFELVAITVDLGFKNVDYTPIEEFCQRIGVEYKIKHTDIGKIVFDIREEKNPCALCSNLKRGALHNAALEEGCNVVALGHHSDDAVETFFLSLFYESRINCFSPVTFLDRKKLTVIRPFIYLDEHQIRGVAKSEDIPVVKSGCPADGKTKREEIKNTIKALRKDYKDIDKRVLKAIQNKDQLNLWFDENGLKIRKDNGDNT